jgi:hypothetical protein
MLDPEMEVVTQRLRRRIGQDVIEPKTRPTGLAPVALVKAPKKLSNVGCKELEGGQGLKGIVEATA